MKKIENYCVILEILNYEQLPVETIDYWDYDADELDQALARYDSLDINKYTAKCIILETTEHDEILIKSEGYKDEK